MAYTPLWKSKQSEARGRGLVLAIDGELSKLWTALADISAGPLSWGDQKSVTISSGEIVYDVDYNYYIVDTEGGAASDTLTKISGVPAGMKIFLRIANAGRTVTLSNGTYLKLQHDFLLDSIYSNVVLVGDGSDVCFEESRSAI